MRLLEYLQHHRKGSFNANTLFFNIKCPYHDDSNPSFGIDLTTGHGKCFSCHAFPNLPQLIEKLEGGALNRYAALRLSRVLELETHDLYRKKERAKWASIFDEGAGLDYLLKRGLTMTSIAEFGISSGMTKDWKNATRPCILFPIHSIKGKKVGEIIRYLDGPKDERYRESEGFDKYKNLWGCHLVKQPMDKLYVCEGIIDAMAMRQCNHEAVSRMGASLTRFHMRIMEAFTKDIVLVVDNDEAGMSAADKYTEKFGISVGLVDCDCCNDVAEHYVTHQSIKLDIISARGWNRLKGQENAAIG